MTLAVGSTAPSFQLSDTRGRRYSYPDDALGQPLLLVFFKSQCEACELALPYIERLRAAYPAGWTVWAVAQDPPEPAAAFAERHGIGCPVLVDWPNYEVSADYDPPATPTFFLIDGAGRVAYATYGFAKDDLNALSRLVAEHTGAEARVVAAADDGRPAFRPG